ncbi:TniQ family protein [Neobacillus sp. YIM B06451]|uniref:TniQ family protein n=1 Tax=Neobacillus sp. YIM B06451 TaxID=3070994 RepID=UPI002931101D|nr:TniQ family protein [Neobacillus sp. YIM B06451]
MNKTKEKINKNYISLKEKQLELIILPEPYEDESFGGYFLRLAEKNFYPTPKYIYDLAITSSQKISGNPYKIDSNLTNLKQLGVLVNLPEKRLWSMLLPYQSEYSNPKTHIEKFKTQTSAKYFSTNNRICIECLKKSKYIKRWWDIFLVTTCPEHSCFLINECPTCNKKLKYNRSKIDFCECGFNLLFQESKPVKDSLDLILSKLILKVCNFTVGETVDKNPLNFVSFEELVDSILAVARTFFNHRYITSPNFTIMDLHEILKSCLIIFEKWPSNYFNALDVLREKNSSDNNIGIRRFGHFYQLLYGKETRRRNANLSLLRVGFKDYLKLNWQYENINLLKNMDINENDIEYVTKNKAAEILRKSEDTIKMLLEKGILKGKIKNNKSKNLYFIELSSIEEYKRLEEKPKKQERKNFHELGELITKIDLERFLLISETTIKELVIEGIFNPVSGPEIGKNSTRIYETKELYSFFSTLDSKVNSNITCESSRLVSFKSARALINCHYADFIKYVFSSEIALMKISNKDEDVNLNQYYFLKSEILNKVKQEINGFNIIEIGSLLGVSRQSVQNWIQKELFTYKFHKGKKVIRLQDIEIFKNKYIPLVRVPFFNKHDCDNTVKKLNEIGIFPVSGFTKDKGKGYLYVKRDIEKICGYKLHW